MILSPWRKIVKKITIKYSNKITIYAPLGTTVYDYGVLHQKKFKEEKEKFKRNGFTIETKKEFYPQRKIIDRKINFTKEPREYQEKALSFVNKPIYNGFIEAPTGSGKTNLMAYLVGYKNLKTIVIVPKKILVEQTIKRFREVLDLPHEFIGTINVRKKIFDLPILVTTWQSLGTDTTRKEVLKAEYNMLICDEAHKSTANKLFEFIGEFKSLYKFGFTASPRFSKQIKSDKLINILGLRLAKVPIGILYQKGFLLKPQVALINTKININIEQGIRYAQEEKILNNQKYRWILINELYKNIKYKSFIDKNRLRKDIAANPTEKELKILSIVAFDLNNLDTKLTFEQKIGIAKRGIENLEQRRSFIVDALSFSNLAFKKENEKAIVLFHTKEACKYFADKMKERGYRNVQVVVGSDKNSAFEIKQLSKGEKNNYIIASTVSLLSEGNDIPALEKIAIGSPAYPPFTDLVRLLQIIGRAVRPDFNNIDKKPLVLLFDDITGGWINKKKEEAYNYAFEEFQPDFITDFDYSLMEKNKKIFLNSAKINKNKININDNNIIIRKISVLSVTKQIIKKQNLFISPVEKYFDIYEKKQKEKNKKFHSMNI